MKQVQREEMPWLKAFLHDDLVNEHSVGFSLNMADPIIRRGRIQALTVKEEVHSRTSIRVAPREFKALVPCYYGKGLGAFLYSFFYIRVVLNWNVAF
ncbi:hypothetical protein DYI25_11300 [Mesobacillus boroniphilus]|uniref:Uncharacterized protein n=1 Tax=Mesobacillus boroniphilus TaxID=308892 RepID=A0A944GWK7_9BACI|nr:hypothetical protein [Mesobacillus boroniphilus]